MMTDYEEPAQEAEEGVDQPQVTEAEKNADAEGAPIATPNTLLDIEPQKETQTPSEQSSRQKPEDWPEDLWDKDKGSPKYEATIERLSVAEKRVEDMRKKLSTKDVKSDAPPEYKFENLPEGLTAEDPSLGIFSKAAKEAGLNNEQANKLISEYYSATAQDIDAKRSSELEKLGPDAQDLLSSLSQFGQSRLNNKTFSDEELGVFKQMVSSASAARVMSKIVEMTGEKPLPVSVRAASDVASLEDIKLAMVAAMKIPDSMERESKLREARAQLARYEGR